MEKEEAQHRGLPPSDRSRPPQSSSIPSHTSPVPPPPPGNSSYASVPPTAPSTPPSPLTLASASSMSIRRLLRRLLIRSWLSSSACSVSLTSSPVTPSLCFRLARLCSAAMSWDAQVPRGLVLGIVGRSASARSLATRSLSFKMNVLYFDVQEAKGKLSRSIIFPPTARRMDTLNDLLAASDLVSLHCALTNETVQIINTESLQHIKPGAFLVKTGSNQLLDDCALKKLLIDGTIAGCALDGAEGPQWMEAWVKEMPNVFILPRSADYNEEVWMEEKRSQQRRGKGEEQRIF